MKTRWGASLLLFISSYAPLALILMVQDMNFETWTFGHPYIVYLLFWGITLSIFLNFAVIQRIQRVSKGTVISVNKIENRTNELVNYALPYLVSFLELDLGDLKKMLCFLIFMALLFLLTVRTQSLFINPILALFGYVLYEAEYNDHGTTKQRLILSPSMLKPGQACAVEPLSPFLLLVTSLHPFESDYGKRKTEKS